MSKLTKFFFLHIILFTPVVLIKLKGIWISSVPWGNNSIYKFLIKDYGLSEEVSSQLVDNPQLHNLYNVSGVKILFFTQM